jgi:hypothetical protein
MTGTTIAALAVGDTAVFDPIYGPERIIEAHPATLPNAVKCLHLHVHDGREKGGSRYIVRGVHEPVVLLP